MKPPRPLAAATVELTDEGSVVVLRTDTGAQLRYGPFSSANGAETAILHLGSALAMAAMRYQTVLRGAEFGGQLHEQGLPDETREKREEVARSLAETMAREGMSRALYTEMLGFLGLPAGVPQPALAYLLGALVEAFGGKRG